jgi:hypothetical protein
MKEPENFQLGAPMGRYEVRLDGTGAAYAVDQGQGAMRYLLQPWSSEFELRLEAVRSLLPVAVSDGVPVFERPAWLACLELAACTLLVADDAGIGLEAGRRLVHECLGEKWALQNLPSGLTMQQVCQQLSQPQEHSLKSLGQDDGVLLGSLRCPAPSPALVARVEQIAATRFAERDYARKRAASFLQYHAQQPVAAQLKRAAELSVGALDGKTLAERIRWALTSSSPLSVIRVGEGEGCFLGYERYQQDRTGTNEVLGICAKDIFRIWFDRNIHECPAAELNATRRLFRDALDEADVIGAPTPARVAYEYSRFVEEVPRLGFSRGYVGVAEILRALDTEVSSGRLRGKLFTDCDIARPLYRWQSWTDSLAVTLPKLLRGRSAITLVTCHDTLAPALTRSLELKNVRTLRIPPERGRVQKDGHLAGDHFQDHFGRICESLKSSPGALVLVAAGFLGKHYCTVAKRAGAVAIDIGSLADYWAGVRTRQSDMWALPSPFI